MNPLYRFFSSIRLTVTLLTLGLLLVFFGTLDQVNIGIRGAQEKILRARRGIVAIPG